jgi:hypothetical protein
MELSFSARLPKPAPVTSRKSRRVILLMNASRNYEYQMKLVVPAISAGLSIFSQT